MRIESDGKIVLGDGVGNPKQVTIKLTRNELAAINSAATRKMVRL